MAAHAEDADRLIEAALADSAAWDRLAYLSDTFGPRFSGSQNLEDAIDWIEQQMREDGLENVRTEDVMVPHWVRGDESLTMVAPREASLRVLGLGGSIGTPEEGITAEVMVVSNFDQLELRADEAAGKIVLFNVPFTQYRRTVLYRVNGAVAAANAGAVASLIRSVGPYSMQTPHTGSMRYDLNVPKIPHAAVTLEDANMIARMIDRGDTVRLTLKMEAETLPDALSRNVMGEIVGSEFPDEIVVIGGHIDSWDVGQGAMDDGGGSVATWEAVRLMHALGLRPKRTVRVVLWTNEENGLRGANVYKDNIGEAINDHVLAIESDSGVFDPLGFGFTGPDAAFEIIQAIGSLLDGIEAGEVTRGGGGADIGPLMRDGVPGMGLRVDGERYFWYHHTDADTMEIIDPRDLAECVATLAVMSYTVANLPDRLPHD
ncbi:MAG: M28 family metallopeptidase [Bacteroidota bacterium]